MPAAFVQSKSGNDFNAASIAATFTSNVAAGSVICGMVFWNDVTNTLTSVSDGTNTYTRLDNPTTVGGGASAAMFYAENVAAGATTVTATFSGNPVNERIIIHEASGLATSGSLDQHALSGQAAPGTGTDATTSGAVVTTANGEYVFGGAMSRNGGITISAGTGYTSRETGLGSSGLSEDQIQSSAGSIAATFTLSSSDQMLIGIMTFKVAAAGPTAAQEMAAIYQALSGTIIGRVDA